MAANWAQASDPILVYGHREWRPNGRQVADYRHDATAALRAEIIEAIAMSEGISRDDVDDDEVDGIMSDAVEIDDGNS